MAWPCNILYEYSLSPTVYYVISVVNQSEGAHISKAHFKDIVKTNHAYILISIN